MAQAENIIAFIEKLENPNVNIDQAKCLKVRNRNASCARCMDACPASCISYANNKVFFDAAACVGCLSCCTVCPTGAMSPKRATDASVMAAAQAALALTPNQVVFACEKMLAAVRGLFKPGSVVPVKCHSSLDVTMLVHLASQGVAEVILATGDCAACKFDFCMNTARQTVATANTLLETWNAPARVKLTQKLPASTRKTEDLGYDETRRGFFTDMRTETKKMAVDAGSVAFEKALGVVEESIINKIKVNNTGSLPLIPNARRARLLAALDSFGTPQDLMIDTGLWAQVLIDPAKCRACRICATFCPTGALFKFHTESGKIGVKQVVRDCVNCGCCTDVCLHGALELCPEVFAQDIAEGTAERYEMEQKKTVSKFALNV